MKNVFCFKPLQITNYANYARNMIVAKGDEWFNIVFIDRASTHEVKETARLPRFPFISFNLVNIFSSIDLRFLKIPPKIKSHGWIRMESRLEASKSVQLNIE